MTSYPTWDQLTAELHVALLNGSADRYDLTCYVNAVREAGPWSSARSMPWLHARHPHGRGVAQASGQLARSATHCMQNVHDPSAGMRWTSPATTIGALHASQYHSSLPDGMAVMIS